MIEGKDSGVLYMSEVRDEGVRKREGNKKRGRRWRSHQVEDVTGMPASPRRPVVGSRVKTYTHSPSHILREDKSRMISVTQVPLLPQKAPKIGYLTG